MERDAINTLNDKHLRLFGIPVSVLAVLLVQMHFYFPGRWDLFWRYAFISVIFTGLIWEIARYIVVRVRRRFPDLAQTRQRVAWLLGIFTIEIAIGQGLLSKMMLDLGWAETEEPLWKIWLINFASSLFFIILIAGIYEAVYFFQQYKASLLRAEELKKQQARASLDALKTRVNPHFLFNSLTTLSELIGEDAPRAERFVDELSKVYRHLLRAGRQPTVALGEELDFAKSYAFLLENRFGEGEFLFNFEKNSSTSANNLEKTLPALALQNAIDYLVRTQNLPLKIEVKAFEKHLEISSNNHPKTRAFDSADNDWQYLENHGARQRNHADRLLLEIPFSQHPAMP